ncbi:hypothetical protein B0H67DRAFT_571091 [Lasiosphaeris hirsuta]|uniref:Uncharacterized protein n=1 Tax=Lasiosphaeris hirsuta TaxID=260670 RepID=A0AA40E2L6_9PEZI|nr:hypothetical protein B0H67DRAFT_571091 [Lasiosphaeris hirsuta]
MAKRKASDSDGHVPIAMANRRAGDDGGKDTNKPMRLTRKNLALFNSLNGDNNSGDDDNNNNNNNNSGYPESENDSDSDTMNNLSTTTSGFEARAYENGILSPNSSKPAQDLDNIRHHLTRRRSSTQPSENTQQKYYRDISASFNESTASYDIHSKIMKEYDDPRYGRLNNRAITRIRKEGFNNGLSNPNPDRIEGFKTSTLPNHTHNHALHDGHSLALCHFAAELKRIDGNLHQAGYQAAYDGATLVHARDKALAQAKVDAASAHGLGAVVDKVAKETAVVTCATDGKVAEVFAHHFQNGEYHQNLVARESLLDYPNKGRELIRNAQDFARAKPYELLALLGIESKEEAEA